MAKHRLQFGSQIVEVTDNPEDEYVYLTVSKERYAEDNVQIKLPRHGAVALGYLLKGDEQ